MSLIHPRWLLKDPGTVITFRMSMYGVNSSDDEVKEGPSKPLAPPPPNSDKYSNKRLHFMEVNALKSIEYQATLPANEAEDFHERV